MSEQVNTSAPASEPEQPETTSPPKKGDKRKLWLMIVAVIVAILLISTAVYVLVISDGDEEEEGIGLEIESEILPSDAITMDAGEMIELSVTSALVNDTEDISHDIDTWTNVTYAWSRTPYELGMFNLQAKRVVEFTAADVGMTGTVTCKITWGEESVQVTADVTVNPPFLDSVIVTPSVKTLAPEQPQVFTASAIDSIGDPMTGLTYSWTLTGMDSADYTLSATTGTSVTFTGLVNGNATLNATATVGGVTKTGSAAIQVGGAPMRTLDYRYYDLFNVPFGEWWDLRWEYYGEEEVISDVFPYVYIWYGNETNLWYYTNQRLEITGRNMPELNMNERPGFLPLFGGAQGGTAEIDWYMQYLTPEEMERYPDNTAAWLDGWVVSLNGTATLDKAAAMSVMGITSDGFDDFDTWWNLNKVQFLEDYTLWILDEGNERLDIFCSYDYPLMPLSLDVTAEKEGDKIVLTYDIVSWGMEVLMTRWFKDSFMDSEWYFEDMDFHATIGPEYTDLDVDTVCVYAAYAYESAVDKAPIWMWEALMQDYVPSTGAHPYSLYDVYEDFEYLNLAPGSPWYEQWMPYDYAPGAHNISENETLVFEWPDADDIIFYGHGGEYVVNEYVGAMTCDYSEPDWVEFPGQVVLDKDARTLTFNGPIDFWTWSKYQGELYTAGGEDATRYPGLGSEWDRLGVFPYGCPTVEFRMRNDTESEPTSFRVEGIPYEIMEETPASVTVTVLDQYGGEYKTYTGTIQFSSNDTGATLPAQYTFVSGDLGKKTFTDGVTFSAAGTYYVMVEDVSDPTISGSQENIVVTAAFQPVPTSLRVEGVTDPIMEGVASGFTVTVLDQLGNPYLEGDYVGTINFTSSDDLAELPDDYTFTVGDDGTHTWDAVDGVVFHTPGVQDLTAHDIDTPSIAGSQLNIDVTEAPRMDSFEVVLSADTAIANDTALDVTVTALDQFGDPYPSYVGTVTFSSDDTEADLPMADLEFVVGDAGVKTWVGMIIMGTPGLQTVTVTDDLDGAITGSDDVTVTPERRAAYLEITDMAPTVPENIAETFTVTVYDQYDDVYAPYAGTVTFDTNRSGDVTLPSDYQYVPGTDAGVHDFSATFTALGRFTVSVSDRDDVSVVGDQVDNILVVSDLPYLEYFVVEGIESPMWEDNYSDVTVTAYDQYDNVYTAYEGTITFSTNATADTYDLPDDYTFLVTDDGTKTFPMGVMFEDGGWYTVTVTNVSDTETGSQTDIEIIELEPTTLEITGEPVGDVGAGDMFSLTVSVYHQYDMLCYEYEGTVHFSSSDGGATLPSDYTFTLGDGGTHDFTDEFALVASGDQTITAEDASASISDTVTVSVITPPPREAEYRLYDFLAEPFGAWWTPRWDTYSTDIIVSEGTNANAYLYYVNGDGGSDPNTQGEIYAPYRYNVTARNLTSINVHHPEFMPTPDTPVAGAQADLSVYMQYIYQSWWTVLRADWVASGYYGSIPGPNYALTTQDGYVVTTLYDIRMNREAALEWVGLPTSEADPVGWYDTIGDDHASDLNDWMLNEGNVRLDIAYAYEDNYYDLYTATRMFYDAGADEVTLEVMHFSWGGEVLMTRWLTEGGVSPNHEPWYEDFSMNVSYGETYTNLSLDGVCQYSLHAVEATGTTGGAAWAWEPGHIDYVVEEELPGFVTPDLPSEYEPYYTLTYTSHNAGDNLFGEEVGYEYTPYWFNLTEGEKLIVEMPSASVLGYEGVGLDYTDYDAAEGGDVSAFEAIEAPGTVTLGYYVTGGPVLTPVGQTITVEGPVSFDNTRHTPGGPLHHGAPWIEFDVGATFASANADAPVAAEQSAQAASVAPAATSATSEMLSLVAVVCATMLAVAALGAGRRVYA